MMQRLASIPEGKTIKICGMDCGQCMRGRLSCMGITDGCCIKMVKNDYHGPVLLEVLKSRIAIGRHQAERIFVDA